MLQYVILLVSFQSTECGLCCWSSLYAILQVVQQEYTAKGATIGLDHVVEFESETISLQLPSEGITLEDGWKIVPIVHPMVSCYEH